MKLNSTVTLTFLLLLCMSVIGAVSATLGLKFGQDALRGIAQPFVNPVVGSTLNPSQSSQQRSTFLKEADILEQVKLNTGGITKGSTSDKDKSSTNKVESQKSTKQASKDSSAKSEETATKEVPLTTQDQGVTLEVRAVRQQGNTLVLDIALSNQGKTSREFLYTFLDVMDDQGQLLQATTTGLPTTLEVNSAAATGTISIPVASLNGAKNLSLSLTDYPSQDLQLQVSDIPVAQ